MGIVKQYQKVVAKGGVAGKLFSPLDNTSELASVAKVTLSATQIKALNGTPQVLVPAPGADKYIVVDSIVVALDYSGAVFEGTNHLEFRETNGAGTKVTADVTDEFLDNNADIICEVRGIEAQTARLLNKNIVVVVPLADPTGASATSTLTFTVFYKVITPY